MGRFNWWENHHQRGPTSSASLHLVGLLLCKLINSIQALVVGEDAFSPAAI